MAIAFDAVGGGAGVGTSLTYSHVVGSGSNRYLFVGIFTITTSDVVTGVTYNGVAMTRLASGQRPADSRWHFIYGLAAPDTGTHDVVISASSSVNIQSSSGSYTGVKQTGQPDASGITSTDYSSGAGDTEVTVTTVAANCWVVGHMKNEAGNYSAGSGTTMRSSAASNAWFDNNAAVAASTAVTLRGTCADRDDSCGLAISIAPPGEFTKSCDEAVTLVDTNTKGTGRALGEVVTVVDGFTGIRLFLQTLSEIVTVVDTIGRDITRSLGEVVTIAQTYVSGIGRALAETVTLADSFAKGYVKSFSETVIVSDSNQRYLNGVRVYDWTPRTQPSAPTWTPRNQP